MEAKKQKIFVGISGGVDSSVAAYLLKKEGHDVHGVFVKTWSPEWVPCTWIEEKRDAMRVCAALDIPFHYLDAEEEYKRGVADYMIAEYRAGRTPNPDVLCNRIIKFGVLWDYARSHGADAIATGHYARIKHADTLEHTSVLMRGFDVAKDQSYFLWMLAQQELGHIRFPIGHLQKSDVRTIAANAGLFTSEKKDSQGICFLGDVDMRAFLEHYIEQKRGDVLDETGDVIGEHDGVWFYTLGERHGFRITKKNPNQSPLYIVAKDIKKNTITVSETPQVKKDTLEVTITLRDCNWLVTPNNEKKYTAQIRYHGEHIPIMIKSDRTVVLSYRGVVPLGQSLVVYDGDALVGGGVIDNIS
ncbi:MAG TPA: tRNA 2-thiouridine(34) synthase MnmA [Candidatus Paceibacterota bacterium]|nr:tRNA 2-thiouridine(34) synthase MnmA [Candidatus Paceibacterota bacterium]